MDKSQRPRTTYHTTLINEDGLIGHAYAVGADEIDVKINTTSNDHLGTNPEQLLGLALTTCFNATLEAIEKRDGYEHRTKVKADVDQAHDTHGFQFFVDVTVYIPTDEVDRQTAQAWFELAESRCPVSKLVSGSNNVTFTLVDHWED
ncbi:OsmC family protein [Furfurilactobacillus curtus]|uniref:Dihydroneopterin aldolase n=1 Tax=Furfurilactobacillus curtus TaxID=1746200 RepID=A0ABQ5JNS2_9LACO